jgi:kinesin family protein 4/21/27
VKEKNQLHLSHQIAISELEGHLLVKEEEHRLALSQSTQSREQLLAKERERSSTTIQSLKQTQVEEKALWEKDRDLLSEEVKSLKQSLRDSSLSYQQLQQGKEVLSRSHSDLNTAHQDTIKSLAEVSSQHASLSSRYDSLKQTHEEVAQVLKSAELKNREALQTAALAEKSVAEMNALKSDLQKANERADHMSREKVHSENTIRDLQAQLAAVQNRLSTSQEQSHRSNMERTLSHPRPNGLPPAKLPPLSPPPSIPPPPLPGVVMAMHSDAGHASMSSVSSRGRQSTGSEETHETIPTSAGSVNGILDDATTNGMGQPQRQLIEEQEAMIKTLNKQLAHCETDLQTHIDLVSTLESSLNDSERNCELSLIHSICLF